MVDLIQEANLKAIANPHKVLKFKILLLDLSLLGIKFYTYIDIKKRPFYGKELLKNEISEMFYDWFFKTKNICEKFKNKFAPKKSPQ